MLTYISINSVNTPWLVKMAEDLKKEINLLLM